MQNKILPIAKFLVLLLFCSLYGHYACRHTTTIPLVEKTESWITMDIKFIGHILAASKKHNIDPALITAIIHAESNFNPNARSPAGAKGLMQINDVTARHIKLKNIFDPQANIYAGTKYLKDLFLLFKGNLDLVIAAYNAGPGAVKRYQGVPPYRETKRYVTKVRKLFDQYKSYSLDI